MAGHTAGHTHGFVITTKEGLEIRRKSTNDITQETLHKIADLLGVAPADVSSGTAIATILLGNLEDSEFPGG
jgi:hypothetical protein